jgi:hypothetical protein
MVLKSGRSLRAPLSERFATGGKRASALPSSRSGRAYS